MDRLARELQGWELPASASLVWGGRHAQLCLAFYAGAVGSSELELSYLHSKHLITETSPGLAWAILDPVMDILIVIPR